jgi:hypothetical protein
MIWQFISRRCRSRSGCTSSTATRATSIVIVFLPDRPFIIMP